MVKTSRNCLGGCFFFPTWGWCVRGEVGDFPIFSRVVIISWEETVTTRICFFVAEDFVDLLFGERLFLFIPPFQLICWLLAAILKTGSSDYVFLLKSLN